MDAIELLRGQHLEVETFFRELEMLDPDSPRSRSAIFEMVADALEVHAKLGEEIFYPAARFSKTERFLRASTDEHRDVRRRIIELLELPETHPLFRPRLDELHQAVQRHVEQEEQLLFPLVKTQLGRIRLEELGEELARRAGELERGEPRTLAEPQAEHPTPL